MPLSAPPPAVPGAVPLLGHSMALLRRPFPFLASLPDFGDVVRVRLGLKDAYVVCTAELTRQVLADDRTFDKGGPLYEKAAEIFGSSLATCPHAAHRRQRRLIQPAFHASQLPLYGAAVVDQIDNVIDTWRSGQPCDVLADMTTIASRSLMAAMFTDLEQDTLEQMRSDFRIMASDMQRRVLIPPLLNRLSVRSNRRYWQAKARLDNEVRRLINNRRTDAVEHADLFSMLLTARDPDGTSGDDTDHLSTTELINQVLTFFYTGIESTSATLAWAMHLLATHPPVQGALHDEVNKVLAGSPATYDDLPRLPLTEKIIAEASRMYPTGYFATRVTTRAARLADYPIPEGATVIYSPYLLHHQHSVHADPERFDPERWNGATAPFGPHGTLFSFGAGPRKCIADTLALTETALVLASIASRWHLDPAPGTHVRPALGITLVPHGLRLIPQLRKVEVMERHSHK
ncbi:cytochrome P450 [Streptomyces alanosinicus]|nr:cytochrome P450 [Streptomyces alanosinicus]